MSWEVVGFLAAAMGLMYPIPQLLRVINRGNAKGISVYFIMLWLADKLLSFIYVAHLQNSALMIKYGVGLIMVIIICWYKRID